MFEDAVIFREEAGQYWQTEEKLEKLKGSVVVSVCKQ